ncbi:hypothetical protein SEA_PROVOLONE_25 [Streptomyces phage Provolone]|nr:hypothetical protein SEA_PROVOLONE_25 [Streptomyces phage Provolone]
MGAAIYPPPAALTSTLVAFQNCEQIPTQDYFINEGMQFTQTFKAQANRIYKVTFTMANVDTDGVTGSTYVAKTSAITICRHAFGTSVSTSSTEIGQIHTAVFGDDSLRNSGVHATFWIENPPEGNNTIGISLKAAHTTQGGVRYLAYGNGNRLAIEDAGPAL